MSNGGYPAELSDEQRRELHRIRGIFVQAVRANEAPSIEAAIEAADKTIKGNLFVELLKIELQNKSSEQQLDTGAYEDRFPDFKEEIQNAFSELDQKTSASSPMKTNTFSDHESPLVAPPTTDHAGLAPGIQIGPYHLLQTIGEGGMGTVWMAEQKKPVRRTVALKIIKAGMDTREIIARFEAERQALALMNHPNIAKVLDAGATQQGRPYFVMELVNGIPITKFSDKKNLTTRQRLQLFTSVCRAVQHAHQKGIIHRDIKPSNVLVAMHDDKPIAKVIDFGLAKATGHSLSDKTMFTAIGQMVGTPTYMSPEQAGVGLDVDTRTDVYSLGVLLYELLTGVTPIDSKRLRSAAFAEIQRIIREDDPPAMSNRLSSLGQESQVAAQHRATDTNRLTQMLRGDLDLIVMKALEKDRSRRYDSPSSFAADVDRHLNNEPVDACPPSARYRIQKFIKRNRAGVIAASIVAVAIVAGLAGTTYGLIRAEQARQDATDRAEGERVAKLEAEANFKSARETVDQYLTRVSDSKLLNVPGMQPLRKELLQDALDYYAGFVADHTNSPELLVDLAMAKYKVGVVTTMIGSKQDAIASLVSALETFDELPDSNKTEPQHRILVANIHSKIANLQIKLGRVDDARKSFDQTLRISETVTRDTPDERDALFMLSRAKQGLGILALKTSDHDTARLEIEQAISIIEDLNEKYPDDDQVQRYLAGYIGDLANALDHGGQADDAIEASNRSLEIYEVFAKREDATIEDRDEFGRQLYNLSNYQNYAGMLDESEATLKKVCQHYEEMVRENPTVTDYQITLGYSTGNLGILNGRQGNHEQALEYFIKARKIFERVALNNPGDVDIRLGLAMMTNNVGKAQESAGLPDEAFAAGKQALEIYRQLVADNPNLADLRLNLGIGLQNHALHLCRREQQLQALPVFSEAQAVREGLVAAAPEHPNRRTELAAVLHAQGTALAELDQNEKAVKFFREAIEQEQKAIGIQPTGTPFLQRQAFHYVALMESLHDLKQTDEAIAACEKLRTLGSASPNQLYGAACIYSLAAAEVKANEKELTTEASTKFDELTQESIKTLREAISAGWDDFEHLEQDEDLDVMRELPGFKSLFQDRDTEDLSESNDRRYDDAAVAMPSMA